MSILSIYSNEYLLELYKETCDLGKTANKLNICLETLRKYFISNNLKYNKQTRYSCNDNFFSEDNEKSFYWAGFIAADGNIDKAKPRVCITQASVDHNHLEKFKNDINYNGKIFDVVRKEHREKFLKKEYYSSYIKITSRQIINDLSRFNITPNKSKTYQFPEYLSENENIRHFIRGIIDGDGWIYKDGGSSIIGLSGTFFCVNFIFNFLKNKLRINTGKCSIRPNGLTIMQFTKTKDNAKIINYLYDGANIFLDRKEIIAEQISPKSF